MKFEMKDSGKCMTVPKDLMQNGQNSVAGSEATNGGVSGTIGKLAENVQINVS